MEARTLRERMKEGIVLPEFKAPPPAEGYVPLGLQVTEGNPCIELLGEQILNVSNFELDCTRRLPRGPLGASRYKH